MMKSALKAKLARLGPTRDIDRVQSGSPEVVVLARLAGLEKVRAIEATFAIGKRGVPMLRAKRAVETALNGETAVLNVPMVEDIKRLATELRNSGFAMSVVSKHVVDVRRLRERLGLTQEQFALRYGLELDAIRNWEYGRREPDSAARSYLAVIDRDPVRTHEALTIHVP